jgi:hypothetical protein
LEIGEDALTYNLFIDDERMPPEVNATATDVFHIVRNYDDAVKYVTEHGVPQFISFDHDLGKGLTGYDFAKWLCEYIIDNNLRSDCFEYYVHSQNPVGAKNIIMYLEGFKKSHKP